jgi:hypothetical protein
MLENECSKWVFVLPLLDNYSNGGMEIWIVGGKRSRTHLKWT